ncbi:uncharacterized protein EHS24_006575 [Apiotrichum porosum]|uniref:Uncharacterized protein n=1 Tax=Apiotrichum porosum TaxID=105984 RepID=A0A427Y1J8_9TREE|nr:uncharacterized protein EHS24_006575 [Apiotrichum porosum]RSH84998.1 hypothetical protein EHS24_006575 [Apiotrichum porosum]
MQLQQPLHPPSPRVTLDCGWFPHIMDSVIDYGCLQCWLGLRVTSRQFRERIDNRLWSHSVVRNNQNRPPYQRCTPPLVIAPRGTPQGADALASGAGIVEKPDPGSVRAPAFIQAAAHTKVLDVITPLWQTDILYHLEGLFQVVHTLRVRFGTPTHEDWLWLQDQRHMDINKEHLVKARKYVFFGTGEGALFPHALHPDLPTDSYIDKVVFNAHLSVDREDGRLLLDKLAMGCVKGKTIVYVIHDLPTDTDRTTDPSTDEISRLNEDLVDSYPTPLYERYLVVNIEALVNPLVPPSGLSSVDEIREDFTDQFRGRFGEVAAARLAFLSREEYQATLAPGEWETETVE